MSDTRLFTVYYNDSTYLSYDFTKDDYEAIKKAMVQGLPVAETSVGLLRVSEIRSVILQKVKADVPQHEGANPELPPEAIEWMQARKLAEKILDEPDDSEGETDYIGGTIL